MADQNQEARNILAAAFRERARVEREKLGATSDADYWRLVAEQTREVEREYRQRMGQAEG